MAKRIPTDKARQGRWGTRAPGACRGVERQAPHGLAVPYGEAIDFQSAGQPGAVQPNTAQPTPPAEHDALGASRIPATSAMAGGGQALP